MEDQHDKARARNVLQSVLSTLMDWDWKLCLFETMPDGWRRAPTWPEVRNGDDPVQLPMTMGSISQAKLAEVSDVFGALSFPVYGQDKIFDVFELVEFLATAHTPPRRTQCHHTIVLEVGQPYREEAHGDDGSRSE